MQRRAVTVFGIVQGVGFRPFVYHLATQLQLAGYVRNQSGTVHIEIEGRADALDAFLQQLRDHAPPLARIDQIRWEPLTPHGDRQFCVAASQADASSVFVGADAATCDACLAELFDPADRRYHYPFLNCTHCGPRLTIITGAPYDRQNTTMAPFAMCAECRAEYHDPTNRRFHAQPIACPRCGPQLQACTADGAAIAETDLLEWFVAALRRGSIGAIKGLGGYHLVCDACNSAAVGQLRSRKHRDQKPLAVMLPHSEAVTTYCHLSADERTLLESRHRPIVLLRKTSNTPLAAEIAPANPHLGVMLPYTPLHHLLLRSFNGPLVMTSGNRSDEPIAYQDDDALDRLRDIADVFLLHNRPIHVRCDDSVTRITSGSESPLRRSRGYAPEPISIHLPCPQPLLAVGAQLKSTFALGRGGHAFLSHHLGDLDHLPAFQAFERDITLYEQLLAVRPQRLVCDLHPDYASTQYATQRAARDEIPLLAVQHHHAHLASCLAEHQCPEPAIGVIWDGAGLGTDAAIWGGEFLVGDCTTFHRSAHLRYVGMPGGEQATREPWRMALAHLSDAAAECPALAARLSDRQRRIVTTMLQRQINTPLTSSMGRLFDAVAALAGVRDSVAYEGQAAMELEWLATDQPPDRPYPWDLIPGAETAPSPTWVIDTRPLIRAIAEEVYNGVQRPRIASRFHTTLVEMMVAVCETIRAASGLRTVVLSGGVFMNALVARQAATQLASHGFHVLQHRLVPPNDGGLSLGQLAIAAAQPPN